MGQPHAHTALAGRALRSRTSLGLLCVALAFGPACSCGSLTGDEGPVEYVRCGQAEPQDPGQWRAGALSFARDERTLQITGKGAIRLAAFTGPVGRALSGADVARIAQAKPDLVAYLGGLGDDEKMVQASLQALAAQPLPVLFVPGGADRWPLVKAAFEDLEGALSQRLILTAGLHRIDIGASQFAVMPGAPLGRYAVDDEACGFGPADVEAVQQAFEGTPAGAGGRRLLAWAAPSGWGLSAGAGRLEVGSPDLHILATALGAEGGLFAYPRGEGTGVRHEVEGSPRWIVPRVSAEGSVSAEGAYAEPGVALLSLPASES